MTQSLNSEPSQAVSALIEAGCHYCTVSISETAGDPDKPSRVELERLMRQHWFALTESFGNERNYTLNFQIA